ncbi:MAG TPA: hypothetical protein PKK60_03020, partial [archaeon]|nr:hypothetical protein [archaeon]
MSTIFNKNKIQKTIESLKKTLNTQKTIKSPNATSIAQGTIEYLVIIAVVIVIALVVVALILNMTDYDQVQIMSNKNQNLIGKGGISIIDSAINSAGEGVILFQNTLGESLTIKSITPGAESSCEKMLSSGTKYSCYLTNIDSVCPCNAKERVICDFKINFETKEGIQKSETFTIINDCTDQPITNPNNNLLINLISPNSGTIVTSLDSNTNFNFRANKVTTDCNLYIKTLDTWNFAENRLVTTARNTQIT